MIHYGPEIHVSKFLAIQYLRGRQYNFFNKKINKQYNIYIIIKYLYSTIEYQFLWFFIFELAIHLSNEKPLGY